MARRRRKTSADPLAAVVGLIVAMVFWQIALAVVLIIGGVWLIYRLVRWIDAWLTRREAHLRLAAAYAQAAPVRPTCVPPPAKRVRPPAPPMPSIFRCDRCRVWLPGIARYCRRCGKPHGQRFEPTPDPASSAKSSLSLV